MSTPERMKDPKRPVLEVKNLRVSFRAGRGQWITPVSDVSFTLGRGEIVGLVGESGCGKSLTARAILGLVGRKPWECVEGEAVYDGENLLGKGEREMTKLLGRRLALVPQDPMTSLNPVYRVGAQVAEPPRLHEGASRGAAWDRAVEMLERVGIERAADRASGYPHEFSGGMRQRAIIGMGLICRPDVLIADEPTTALDVTVQAGILELIRELRREMDSGILFITHDLGVVAELCDRILVMYAGRIVEEAETRHFFRRPTHPYSEALLNSVPTLDTADRLEPIQGQPPEPREMPPGCPFHPRCPLARPVCREKMPDLLGTRRHKAACWERRVEENYE